MERIDKIVKRHLPEAVKWELICKYSASISNPDNAILDGLYDSYFIRYYDSYDAEYYECIRFKNNEYLGSKSDYKDLMQREDEWCITYDCTIDIYQLCIKYQNEKSRAGLIFYLLEKRNLNKNQSIRDYVVINKKKNECHDTIKNEAKQKNRNNLKVIHNCDTENNHLLEKCEKITEDYKNIFESIKLLVRLMVDEKQTKERKNIADKICELIEKVS